MLRSPLIMKRVIATVDGPAAIGPYSQAVAVGDALFCSGQIPIQPATGELVDGDVSSQTTQVLENLGALLRANGMTYSHVVKTTVFMVDLKEFAKMNEVYALYFPEVHPARSTIQVAALPKGAQVEIEAIALGESVARSPKVFAAPVDLGPASPL